MLDGVAAEIIDQITLYKLDFSKQLLRDHDLPAGGSRAVVKQRLTQAVDSNRIPLSIVQELLNTLDLWGHQRVRWAMAPVGLLSPYQTPAAISARAEQAGMSALLDGEIMLVPPDEFTPMIIAYQERASGRYLLMMGAKTQIVREEKKQLEAIRQEQHPDLNLPPGVVYYPFEERPQKVVGFVEIDLDTRLALISATLVRQGIQFAVDYQGLYRAFDAFFPMEQMDVIDLFQANRAMHDLPPSEVQLAERRRRTSTGGVVSCKSHHKRADIRADSELGATHLALPDAPGVYNDCNWQPLGCLDELVHTQVYGPNGEISILGKVKEQSARHVLRRILEINH